jgi:hypothetical protein
VVISATATKLKVLVPDGGEISVKVGTQTVTSDDNFVRLSIYVSGYETSASNKRFAVYWKDGDEIILSDALTDAFATDIAVSGGNVYVTGSEANTPNYIAKYWKNTIPVPLTEGKFSASASGIAIEGNNVYTCGSERNDKGHNVVKYWKNNTPVTLTDKPGSSFATAISVVGSNVYTAIYNDGYPGYFENTIPQMLSSNSLFGSANAISVKNNDIYTSGDLGYHATYWKNKMPVPLTDYSEHYSSADAIFLSGNDVYTAGQFRKTISSVYLAVYWKNNKQIALTDGSKRAAATGIEVVGNNVYVAGDEGNTAKLWKNGKVLYELTDGFTTARATGMVIAPY